jgi:hypothetical protein
VRRPYCEVAVVAGAELGARFAVIAFAASGVGVALAVDLVKRHEEALSVVAVEGLGYLLARPRAARAVATQTQEQH